MNMRKEKNPGLKFIREFEGGKLYTVDNSLLVLSLAGTYREMGRQEGGLLKDYLTQLLKKQQDYFSESNHPFLSLGDPKNRKTYTLSELKDLAGEEFSLHYPRRFQQILEGMRETSGIDLKNLSFINQIVRLDMPDSFVKVTPGSQCSAIAVWGNYTADGKLIFGRNFDWCEDYKKFSEYVAVTVHNPVDGSNPTASVGYIGSIEILTGMNSKGLFIELNNGVNVIEEQIRIQREPFIDLTGFLFDISRLDQLDEAIKSTRTMWPVIVNVADENISYSYEWSTFEDTEDPHEDEVKRRNPDKDGLLVATNHFVDPSWGSDWLKAHGHIWSVDHDSPAHSATRRNNLLYMGSYKGKFDVKTMETVLETPIDKGGATRPTTVIQVIAVPKERVFYVRVPGSSVECWNEVDLKGLFRTDI
jgi:hypothetical protein